MIDVSSHPAFENDQVTLDHSIAGMGHKSRIIDPAEVEYLIINPHSPDPETNFRFKHEVERHLPGKREFQAFSNSENDAGVYPLVRSLLETRDGGLAITVNHTRGLVNANNLSKDGAVNEKLLTPGTPEAVIAALRAMHGHSLELINLIIAGLPMDLEVLDLHSMEPHSIPKDLKIKPAHDNLPAYLERFRTSPRNDTTRRPVDLITGPDGKPPIADMEMNRALGDLLKQMGIPSGYNTPYDTDPDYPDHGYMVARQVQGEGRVIAVDLRKTDLCKGDADSFDTTNPVVDRRKVRAMAEMYTTALDIVQTNRGRGSNSVTA